MKALGKLSRRSFLKCTCAATGLVTGGGFVGQAAATERFSYNVDRFSTTDVNLVKWHETAWFSCGGQARALTVDGQGKIYVATGKRVAIFDANGGEIEERAGDAPVRCVAVGLDGSVYAGFRDHIKVFGPKASKAIATWEGVSGRTWFTGLAVQGESLFAADAGNRCVLRYDKFGKVTARLGTKDKEKNVAGLVVPSPYLKVQIAPDGLLRVNNPGRHRVEVHTPDGDLELFWGKAGAGIQSFCGCCNPVGVAVLPDGRTVTAEKGLPRVKVYSSTGEFECVVAGPEAFPENARAGSGRDPSDGLLGGLDVAVDRLGRILVLDLVTARVHVMEAKG